MQSWYIGGGSHGASAELREVPVPEPGPGELLIKVHAAGLNRGEFLSARTLPAGTGKAGGIEAAGEVVKLGAGARAFKAGDRVMGRARGAFSEYAVQREGDAIPAPATLSWVEAAGASIAYLAAHDMLWTGGELKAGEWLLVTGASAGVGVASIQLGKLTGAKVIGTSGSAAKLARLYALGLDLGLQNRNGGFEKAVMEATSGKGVDLAINNVGGSVFDECVRTLAYKGRLAMVGHVDGLARAEIDIMRLHARRLRLFGVSNGMRTAAEIAEAVRMFVRDVVPLFASGRLRPVIDRSFPFGELPQAMAHMESNRHVGKIILGA